MDSHGRFIKEYDGFSGSYETPMDSAEPPRSRKLL
jgi:hypothetical protein